MSFNPYADYSVDKRKYFRIDAKANLSINTIQNVNNDEELQEYFSSQSSSQDFENEINYASERMLPLGKNIQIKNPEIFDYMVWLENKIDVLSKQVKQLNSYKDTNSKIYNINISASGMQFVSENSYKINDYLEINISLMPDNLKLYLIAKLTRESNAHYNHFNVAVEFILINEADKEALIKYIHKKQINNLHG